jgi:hypothetical protein
MVTERTTWTVYRDGYRWTVGAKHLPDALRRACLQTDAMSGQQFVDAGTRREPCEAPAPNGLPIAFRIVNASAAACAAEKFSRACARMSSAVVCVTVSSAVVCVTVSDTSTTCTVKSSQ